MPGHILEGRSLLPILHGTAQDTGRDYVICEYDYSPSAIANNIGVGPTEGFMFMVATKKWKLMHFEGSYRPMLFDLKNDPDELVDLGDSPDHEDVIADMYEKLNHWARRPSQRTTRSHEDIKYMRVKSRTRGIVLGFYDETEVDPALTVKYRGRKAEDKRAKADG